MPESRPRARRRVVRAHVASLRRPLSHVETPAAPEPTFSLSFPKDVAERLIARKRERLLRVGGAVVKLGTDLESFFPKLGEPLPRHLTGLLVQPDGRPAAGLRVSVRPPVYSEDDTGRQGLDIPWPRPFAVSDAKGRFRLELPPVPRPAAGLTLDVHGKNRATPLELSTTVVARGDVGLLDLPELLFAFPEDAGLVGRLVGNLPTSDTDVVENHDELTTPSPDMRLGEGDCARYFRADHAMIDRFQYGLLYRLVEPDLGQRQVVSLQPLDGADKVVPVRALTLGRRTIDPSLPAKLEKLSKLGDFEFADRVAIDAPISVHDFHEQVIQTPTEVCKAGSLGLGYVLKMRQFWIPSGYSLGDLLYSLALAPREEQRIIVQEARQTLSVRDDEALRLAEEQTFDEQASSSAEALFSSVVNMAAHGESEIESTSKSGAVGGGVFLGIPGLFGVGIGGGYSSTSTDTTTTSEQHQTRDFASSATETLHAELSRVAQARRSASRTSVRLASSSDRERISTRLIANRNNCHSLTMQYWEVLRHFQVNSEPDDVQLVCFVPLELVPFFQEGQQTELPTLDPEDADQAAYRRELCTRYARLLQYVDVLEPFLPRRHSLRTGVAALRRFAANPITTVETKMGPEQQVIEVSMRGTFFRGESASVTVVLQGNRRLGPFPLVPDSPLPSWQVTSPAQLLERLLEIRGDLADAPTLRAHIPIDALRARNDVLRFELVREPATLFVIESVAGLPIVREYPTDAAYHAVGGPRIYDVTAVALPSDGGYVDAFASESGAIEMPVSLGLAASTLPPVLSYTDLLHIEELFHHVVRNTVPYSKVVWQMLTPAERALLLEEYTIGVGSAGDEDVPLLDCVENRVLGFFGNSMIMPFFIPASIAGEEMTTLEVQEALLRFHRQGHPVSQTSITLPTSGVLAEAVLGACTACEKVDLTRFWNWKDAPIPKAADPGTLAGDATQIQGLVPAGGAAAATGLAQNLPTTLINNITTTGEDAVPAPSAGLLAQLVGAKEPTISGDVTGRAQLQAVLADTTKKDAAALSAAIDSGTGMAKKVLGDLPSFLQTKTDIAHKKVADVLSDPATLAKWAGQGDEDARAKKVNSLNLAGLASGLGTDDKVKLYKAFAPSEKDSEDVKNGKKALLEALGLED